MSVSISVSLNVSVIVCILVGIWSTRVCVCTPLCLPNCRFYLIVVKYAYTRAQIHTQSHTHPLSACVHICLSFPSVLYGRLCGGS